jgi:Domain of unknown function (DUF1929)
MNARLTILILIAALATACTFKNTVEPDPEPQPLEVPAETTPDPLPEPLPEPLPDPAPNPIPEPTFDPNRYEIEANAPTSRTPNGPASSYQQGVWSAKTNWPTLAIHAALMPDKTVVTFGWRRQWNNSAGEDPVHYQICKTWTDTWDSSQALGQGHSSRWYGSGISGSTNPASYATSCPNPNDTDMFGAGHAHTPDGNLFVAGGMGVGATISANKGDPWNGKYFGVNNTNTYNPFTRTWQPGPAMSKPRWYPTVTTLSDGKMLISGGSDFLNGSFGLPGFASASGNADLHERLENGGIQSLPGARKKIPYYPWMIVMPNTGNVLEAGPQPQMNVLNPNGNGGWTNQNTTRADNAFRSYGAAIPIIDLRQNNPTSSALVLGGGGEPDDNDAKDKPDCQYRKNSAGNTVFNPNGTCPLGLKSLIEIDLQTGSSSSKAALKRGRRNLNAVALPSGQVLAIGGNEFWNDRGAQHFTPELYDPERNTWSDLPPQQGIRNYHSTALLLPDASVLSAGGYWDRNFDVNPANSTTGDPNARSSKDAELFYPQYLYDSNGQPASRPWIRAAPKTIRYNQEFELGTPDANEIANVSLIKLGSTTHGFDADQRLVKIGFTRGSDRLRIQTPANGTFAPPGHYMLFILNAQGVPSVARIVKLEP